MFDFLHKFKNVVTK